MKLPKDATEEQKSLALAKLMGYKKHSDGTWTDGKGYWPNVAGGGYGRFVPYENSTLGKAQFATILLEFKTPFFVKTWSAGLEPTQTNILDEILRMEGKIE